MDNNSAPATMSKSRKKAATKKRRAAEEAAANAGVTGETAMPEPDAHGKKQSKTAQKTSKAKNNRPTEPSTPTQKPPKAPKKKEKKGRAPAAHAQTARTLDSPFERSVPAHPAQHHGNTWYASDEVSFYQNVAFNNLSLFTAWHQTMINAWYHGTPQSQHEAVNIANHLIAYEASPAMPPLFLARARIVLAGYYTSVHNRYSSSLISASMRDVDRVTAAAVAKIEKSYEPSWDAWVSALQAELNGIYDMADAVCIRFYELMGDYLSDAQDPVAAFKGLIAEWNAPPGTTNAGHKAGNVEDDMSATASSGPERPRRSLHAIFYEYWPSYAIAYEEGRLAQDPMWRTIASLEPEDQYIILMRKDAAERSKRDDHGTQYPHEEPEASTALSPDSYHVVSEVDSCAVEDDEEEVKIAVMRAINRVRRVTIS